MKRQSMANAIRSIDHALLVFLILCLGCGAIGVIIQLVRWGTLLQPCCGD